MPDIWLSGLDLQPMMVESIVTLMRETSPRWRQLLLGLPEESVGARQGGVERSISGGVGGVGCGGPTGPGGPPPLPSTGSATTASEFLMVSGVSGGGVSTTINPGMVGSSYILANNPSSLNQMQNLDGTSVAVSDTRLVLQ